MRLLIVQSADAIPLNESQIRSQLRVPVYKNTVPSVKEEQAIAIIECRKIDDAYFTWPQFIIRNGMCLNMGRVKAGMVLDGQRDYTQDIIDHYKTVEEEFMIDSDEADVE